MLGLPKSTEIKKIIPKNALFAKFNMNNAAKEKFDADIRRMTLIGEVSENTLAVGAGKTISSFFIMLVSLKKENFDEKNIVLLSKLIDQKILFILECDGKSRLAIFHSKLITSDWMSTEDCSITLSGLDLDTVWENVVVQVGKVEIEQGKTLDEQIEIDSQRQKLIKQIEALDKKARTEKQPKKKFELNDMIKKLKSEVSKL